MKKSITTLVFTLATICATQAQPKSNMGCDASKPSPDAKLQSTSIDGNYKVCKWLVPETPTDSEGYSVRYQINISKLVSSYDQNSKELQELHTFIDDLLADNEKWVTQINVYGYASPDGQSASNQRLAEARAYDMRNYINKKWDLSKYSGTTTGIASTWSDTSESISKSTIPSKSAVLDLVDSKQMDSVIEAKLRGMTSSWDYMIKSILPPMRCVVLHVIYTDCKSVETRTPIVQTEVVEDVFVQNNYFILINEEPSDVVMLVNNNSLPLDYPLKRDKSKVKYKENHRREKLKGRLYDRYGRERSTVKIK